MKKEILKINQTFITGNMGLAAFLLYKGFRLVSVDKKNEKRKSFIFFKEEGIENAVEEFFLKNALVEPNAFLFCLKSLKSLIYDYDVE